MRDLLLATQNEGKLGEMRALLAGSPYRVLGPRELRLDRSPDETGSSFLENARLKARYYSGASGRLALADDSGLAVDALDGAPGLHTAHFGGADLKPQERCRLLLAKLAGVPPQGRGARFWCAVALACGEQVLFEALESVDGFISADLRGEGGFGYDPIFFYPPLSATFAELPTAVKDRVSHRGKALARLRAYLENERP